MNSKRFRALKHVITSGFDDSDGIIRCAARRAAPLECGRCNLVAPRSYSDLVSYDTVPSLVPAARARVTPATPLIVHYGPGATGARRAVLCAVRGRRATPGYASGLLACSGAGGTDKRGHPGQCGSGRENDGAHEQRRCCRRGSSPQVRVCVRLYLCAFLCVCARLCVLVCFVSV